MSSVSAVAAAASNRLANPKSSSKALILIPRNKRGARAPNKQHGKAAVEYLSCELPQWRSLLREPGHGATLFRAVVHRQGPSLQSSSASRFTAGAAGFLNLSHSNKRSDPQRERSVII